MKQEPLVLHARQGRLGGYADAMETAILGALRRAGQAAGLTPRHEISLVLCDNPTIRRLNRRWRQQDRPTDVLSFPQNELKPGRPVPDGLLGDIVISLPTTREAARQMSETPERHAERLAVHGLAHLLGHDHRTDAETRRMEREEERLLGRKLPR